MTATKDATTDRLITIDLNTSFNFPTPRCTVIGNIGQLGVDGMVSSLGELFAMTHNGKLLKLSKTTGNGTVLSTGGPDVYGAASPTQLN